MKLVQVQRINYGLAIEQLTTPDATAGVLAAGSIPYYSGLPAIDFLGKSDRHVAHLSPRLSDPPGPFGLPTYNPGHNKYDLDYPIKELKLT